MNITNYAGATPLIFAASNKNLKLAKLLVENGADINKVRIFTGQENLKKGE